ncbi:MAG: hypothetical protein JO122_02550, partial [Acetobacteraceae bacterium]|nr:hypothetical protein [Acetobacteraceae bacterium]
PRRRLDWRWLRASVKGQAAELIVRDSGVRIPESELARVFERLHRIEGQKSRSFEGSGIGLALARPDVGRRLSFPYLS